MGVKTSRGPVQGAGGKREERGLWLKEGDPTRGEVKKGSKAFQIQRKRRKEQRRLTDKRKKPKKR